MRAKLLFALCLFLVLAGFKTFPLILQLGTHVSDPGDSLHQTWILAWDVHALITHPLQLFDANTFYPLERSLAFSEHLLGILPIFAPIYLITGNAIASYNTVFLLSFALSGFSAFCLAYYWTRAFWPSLVAGSLFGFAPFRFGHLGHLHLLNFFWAPFALIFLDQFLRTRRWRHLAGFAGFYWLQVLSSVALGFMVTVAVGLYVGYYALVFDRSLFSFSLFRKALFFIGASLAVLLPFHLPYLEVLRSWSFARTVKDILFFSPDVLNYLSAPPFMNDLYLLFRPAQTEAMHEKSLFPGLVLPVLAVLGSVGSVELLPSRNAKQLRQLFWLIAGAGVVLSLGPYLIVVGLETRIPLPYLLFYHLVPGFAGIRAPGRFALLAVLAASPLAAVGAYRCCEVVRRWYRSPAWARLAPPLASAGLLGLFLLELGLKPLPLVNVPTGRQVPEVYRWLAANRPGPILELPFGQWEDYRYAYLSTVHWLPLVNGATSFFPPAYAEIEDALTELPAKSAVEYAGALGIRAVVVHTEIPFLQELSRWSEKEIVDSGLRRLVTFGPTVVYSVPPIHATSSLRAESSLPDWVPAGKPISLGLLLRPDNGQPWVHPRPHGQSAVVMQWTDARTGQSLSTTARVRLPLVIHHGKTVAMPLMLRPPDSPGPYTFRVSIPSRGITTEPRAIEIRDTARPTSRDAPRLLSANYIQHSGAGPLVITTPDPIMLEVSAINTGQAIWLAHATDNRGATRLGLRWSKDGQELERLSGRAPIRYDIFPGQVYRFQVATDPPGEPGTYILELGLVSEHVAWFSWVGTPPLRLVVDVRPSPRTAFSELLDRFRTLAPDAPRFVLSAERLADISRLSITTSVGKRSWVVDAYLVLQAPNGALSFYDSRRLVPGWKRPWTPMAKGVRLPKGALGTARVLSLPFAEMRPGTYTWYLLVTEAGSYRIIADARATFEVAR